MPIQVDQEKCIGCGACVSICPDAFQMNDQGKAEVISEENKDCAQEAAQSCPAGAITVE